MQKREIIFISTIITVSVLTILFVILFTYYYLRFLSIQNRDTSTLDINKTASNCSTGSNHCLCSDESPVKQPVCFSYNSKANSLKMSSGIISKTLDLNNLTTDENHPKTFSGLGTNYGYFSYPFGENTVCIYNMSTQNDQRFCYNYKDNYVFLTGPTIPQKLQL
jgi:hypothetical protein